MKSNKTYVIVATISNVLGIIAGIIWIYAGIKKLYVDNWVNIALPIIGVIIISMNLSIFKDIHFKSK